GRRARSCRRARRRRARRRRLPLERGEPLLELRDPPLERVEAPHPLLQLVEPLPHRVRRIGETVAARQVGEPPDRLLAGVGEPGEEVLLPLLPCLSHVVRLSRRVSRTIPRRAAGGDSAARSPAL